MPAVTMSEFSRPPPALLKRVIPLATAIAAVLLDVTPVASAASVTISPTITLAVIFYWSALRPDLLGLVPLFVLALIFDVLAGLPPGLTALPVLLTYGLLWPRRQFIKGQGFLVVWACFALVCLVALGLRWSIACVWWGRLFEFDYLALEILLTIAIYPLVAWLLGQCHSMLQKVPVASGS